MTTLHKWKFNSSTTLFFCVVLAISFALMRALGILGSAHFKFLLPLGFVLMAIVPWALLTREGWVDIGFVKPIRSSIFLNAVLYGAGASLVCFVIGIGLFGVSADNWYVSIAHNFRLSVIGHFSVMQLYLMFTIPSLIFSPIGEEIFFRGVLQDALEERFSAQTSTWIESLLFGFVHLCHHGIVIAATGVSFLFWSAPIWFVLMVMVALMFAHLRKRSQSLYPAIVSHMAFNFVMCTVIFLVLWPVD